MRALALALLVSPLFGCASSAPKKTIEPAPRKLTAADVDGDACAHLCKEEVRCGAELATCQKSCLADASRMKRGFVADYVRCFLPTLAKSCPTDDERTKAHDRCFDVALAPFSRDVQNQRDMAEAVCDRGLRCQGIGTLGRDLCLQATLDPKEPEVKLGQRLVDGLRRDRVIAFKKCVDDAPCAKPDSPDRTVDDCYAKTIAGAP
ncbi:MAG: hypothetical protein ACXVEE_30295 [Polyangiales bacterium]